MPVAPLLENTPHCGPRHLASLYNFRYILSTPLVTVRLEDPARESWQAAATGYSPDAGISTVGKNRSRPTPIPRKGKMEWYEKGSMDVGYFLLRSV